MNTPPSGEHGGSGPSSSSSQPPSQGGGGSGSAPRPSWPPPPPAAGASGSAPPQQQQQQPHGYPPQPQGPVPAWGGARPGMPPGYGPQGPGGGGPPGTRPAGGGRFPLGMIFLLIMVVLMIVYFTSGPTDRSLRPARVQDGLQEVAVQTGTADYKVALVDARGILIDQRGGLLGLIPSPIEHVENSLKRIDADPQVHAMVLIVNSPGGGLTASDRLHHTIKSHVEKWRAERPSFQYVVLMEDVAASGGYYIAAHADHIVAHPTTITGSIGVIMQSLNYSQLLEMLGIEDRTVTSAPYKDLGNPMSAPRPMEDLYFQQLIDEMHERFVDVVYEGRRQVIRNLTRERVSKEWADGRIFTAAGAKELGMIDEVGYRDDAIAWVQAQIDPNETPNVVHYRPRPLDLSLFSFMQDGSELDRTVSDAALAKQIKRLLEEAQRDALTEPRLWALWPPGLAKVPGLNLEFAAAAAAQQRD